MTQTWSWVIIVVGLQFIHKQYNVLTHISEEIRSKTSPPLLFYLLGTISYKNNTKYAQSDMALVGAYKALLSTLIYCTGRLFGKSFGVLIFTSQHTIVPRITMITFNEYMVFNIPTWPGHSFLPGLRTQDSGLRTGLFNAKLPLEILHQEYIGNTILACWTIMDLT